MEQSNNKLRKFASYFAENRWPWHFVFWVLHYCLMFYTTAFTVLYYLNKGLSFGEIISYEQRILMLVSELIFVATGYLTLWVYKKFSKLATFFIGLLIWLGYLGSVGFSQVKIVGDSSPRYLELAWTDYFFGNMIMYMLTFFLLLFAKYGKDSFIAQWHKQKKDKMLMVSELRNLKAQISPHFLFNTLNNFYGLAVEKSDKLPDLMIRLSDLLRYSLYQTKNATVPLDHEIAHLNNYISLEKIRLEDDLALEFNTSIPEGLDLHITPLLLIVPVENAFKHSKKYTDQPISIKIDLVINQDTELLFQVKNNCLVGHIENSDGGLGLETLNKRLEAFYPEQSHTFSAQQVGESFTATLKLNLGIESN